MQIKMDLETLNAAQQQSLINIVQNNEGFRPFVYDDSTDDNWVFHPPGNPTWLYGIDLREPGDKNLGYLFLTYTLCQIESELLEKLPWFSSIDDNAKMALLDMAYNLGVEGLLSFGNFLAYLKGGQYAEAAKDLAQTKWFAEVKGRAARDQALISSCE